MEWMQSIAIKCIAANVHQFACLWWRFDFARSTLSICEHDLSQQTLKPVVNTFSHHWWAITSVRSLRSHWCHVIINLIRICHTHVSRGQKARIGGHVAPPPCRLIGSRVSMVNEHVTADNKGGRRGGLKEEASWSFCRTLSRLIVTTTSSFSNIQYFELETDG